MDEIRFLNPYLPYDLYQRVLELLLTLVLVDFSCCFLPYLLYLTNEVAEAGAIAGAIFKLIYLKSLESQTNVCRLFNRLVIKEKRKKLLQIDC